MIHGYYLRNKHKNELNLEIIFFSVPKKKSSHVKK